MNMNKTYISDAMIRNICKLGSYGKTSRQIEEETGVSASFCGKVYRSYRHFKGRDAEWLCAALKRGPSEKSAIYHVFQAYGKDADEFFAQYTNQVPAKTAQPKEEPEQLTITEPVKCEYKREDIEQIGKLMQYQIEMLSKKLDAVIDAISNQTKMANANSDVMQIELEKIERQIERKSKKG